MRPIVLALSSALILTACATAEAPSPAAPSLAIAAGEPLPPQAQFHIDCMRHAIEERSYDRDENLIRFHCSGDVARRFYEGLGPRSARIGSEYSSERRTLRFTEALQEDATGVDFCSRDSAGAYACTVIYNAGGFLED